MNIVKSVNFKSIFLIVLSIFCIALLALSVRGLRGNPDEQALNSSVWAGDGSVPFGSSNDQGRFALTYAVLENHSFKYSFALAQFSAPDLAMSGQGAYVSLFAPGVSFLIMPGYIIGKILNASQVGAFMVVSIFALLNTLLIYLLVRKFGANIYAAGLGALTFLFATPAYSYAVSLSQHHFSVFCLLLSIYLVTLRERWWSLSLIWFLCALSIVIDNPNVIFMFPIGLYALGRIILLKKDENNWRLVIRPIYFLSFATMFIPLVFFAWFNQHSNGSAFQLSGTLKRVVSVNQNQPQIQTEVDELTANTSIENNTGDSGNNKEKTAVGFFQTRNLWNGFFVHFVSPDRGIIWFTPVVILGVFGLIFLFRTNQTMTSVLIATIGSNILLYSMWGDPWGGWAFGSRYLIPTYALLCVGIGVALSHWKRNLIFLLLFFVLFFYSVQVNALGALGTSSIPPQNEVVALEALTGKVQKYNFERSRDFLYDQGSRSFIYQIAAKKILTATQYYSYISYSIIIMGGIMVVMLWFIKKENL